MGLKRDIAGLVSLAIGLTGDLSPVIVYRRHTGTTYDVKLGKPVDNFTDYGASPGSALKGTLARFSESERDSEVNVLTDQKILIAFADLERLGFPAGAEPSHNDDIIINGVKWDVRRVLGVPGNSLYILHIRKT